MISKRKISKSPRHRQPIQLSPQNSNRVLWVLNSGQICWLCHSYSTRSVSWLWKLELVIADLLIAQPPSPPPVPWPPYRNIKNINVSLFCNDLENQNLATFSNGKNVDSMWLEWIEKFNEVLDRHAPLRSPQGSHRKVQRRTRCDCPWMTPELRLVIRQKLKAHRHLSRKCPA